MSIHCLDMAPTLLFASAMEGRLHINKDYEQFFVNGITLEGHKVEN